MQELSFKDLRGKVCVITGGAGVLGTAMVRAMASVGMKITIADINKEVADKVAAEISSEYNAVVIGVEANVLDKESLEKAKDEINARLGNIDILVNGAGGNSPQATTKVSKWRRKTLTILLILFMVCRWKDLTRSIPSISRAPCCLPWYSPWIC